MQLSAETKAALQGTVSTSVMILLSRGDVDLSILLVAFMPLLITVAIMLLEGRFFAELRDWLFPRPGKWITFTCQSEGRGDLEDPVVYLSHFLQQPALAAQPGMSEMLRRCVLDTMWTDSMTKTVVVQDQIMTYRANDMVRYAGVHHGVDEFSFIWEGGEFGGTLVKAVVAATAHNRESISRTLTLRGESHAALDALIVAAKRAFLEDHFAKRLSGPPRDYRWSAADKKWLSSARTCHKSLGNIFLAESVAQYMTDFVADLQACRKLQQSMGQPVKSSLLLHGPPGTGKSSIANALAGDLAMPLYRVEFTPVSGPVAIKEQLDAIPPNSLVLLDDLHLMLASRDSAGLRKDADAQISSLSSLSSPSSQTNETTVSVSTPKVSASTVKTEAGQQEGQQVAQQAGKEAVPGGVGGEIDALTSLLKGGRSDDLKGVDRVLQAALDGYDMLSGCVVVATTNDLAVLTEALKRPGRLGRPLEILPCDGSQVAAILRAFEVSVSHPGDRDLPIVMPTSGVSSALLIHDFLPIAVSSRLSRVEKLAAMRDTLISHGIKAPTLTSHSPTSPHSPSPPSPAPLSCAASRTSSTKLKEA